ncbi:hypothetical protein LCGC14_0702830 [marine sediment metagenome]|uniref:PAS domain-containing protein n=1 Tax=marine sediment metagenome TaxID=412755 RepID=A0A0F9TPZ8_9ZZZZ
MNGPSTIHSYDHRAERLESRSGSAVVTDTTGKIIACNQAAAGRFGSAAGAARAGVSESILGESIYDLLPDDDTRRAFREFADGVTAGSAERLEFCRRCDRPGVQRAFLVRFEPVHIDACTPGVLFQIVPLLEAGERSKRSLRPEAYRQRCETLPLLRVCSYCEHVLCPGRPGKDVWVQPSQYYQSGGTDAVRLSHGICPTCFEHEVTPELERLRSRRRTVS